MKTCSGLEEVFQQILAIRVRIYLSKFTQLHFAGKPQCHNSQTSNTSNTNDLLEPQRLQSYNTNSSWQWGQTDQTKCGVNLHCSAKYLKFIAKYLLARQFLMSRRQCSSNKLLSLQKCQFFFSSYTVSWILLTIFNITHKLLNCLLSCLKQR